MPSELDSTLASWLKSGSTLFILSSNSASDSSESLEPDLSIIFIPLYSLGLWDAEIMNPKKKCLRKRKTLGNY